ncbi:hypothetical protein K6119_17485 [Paracrocinitomix mangrovi]|uniref:hypothetical protein n=1 Tax=Paracrocinitomix mangrovi TaxID=2862509 RepID=UPI001C8DD5C5|nr:hypothetical protein [Paracrocinitomix mangrovi]UKN01519.1 hypothetical protein K6119_17485 [Paracrocinitomix mangrovi]
MATKCEPDPIVPDQNKIYGSYELNFNESENKTSAKAIFYLNPPSTTNQQKLELNHPANVTYNGDQLIFNINGRYYFKSFVGAVENQFVYTNFDDFTFTNGATIPDSIDLIITSDTISQQANYYFQIEGDNFLANEFIDVTVTSLSSDFTFGSTFDSLSVMTIEVSAQQLQELGSGKAVIKVTRRLENPDIIQVTPAGGNLSTQYSVQDTVFIY